MKQIAAKQILANKLDLDFKQLYYMQQVHGDNITLINDDSTNPVSNCDAMISTQNNVALLVLVADCIPVLIADQSKNIIAAVHAGRNGVFLNIVAKTIAKMQFHSQLKNMQIILGPCIKQCCYEVNETLAAQAKQLFGDQFVKNNYLDLVGMLSKSLFGLGVNAQQIQVDPTCTKCSHEYFSYRQGDSSKRFAGVITQ